MSDEHERGDGDGLVAAPENDDAALADEVRLSVPPHFCIDSQERANWLVRRIVGAREYIARVKDWSALEQRRGEREEATLLFLFGRQLEAWARAEIQTRFNGRRRSLALPGGTVGYRKLTARLVIDDETTVLPWAKTNCKDAVLVVEKLSKSMLDAYVRETGDLPAGAHIEPATDRFFIS